MPSEASKTTVAKKPAAKKPAGKQRGGSLAVSWFLQAKGNVALLEARLFDMLVTGDMAGLQSIVHDTALLLHKHSPAAHANVGRSAPQPRAPASPGVNADLMGLLPAPRWTHTP